MFLTEHRTAGIGRVGNDQTGSPLIDQALQVFQVNLPRLLRLKNPKVSLNEAQGRERFSIDTCSDLNFPDQMPI